MQNIKISHSDLCASDTTHGAVCGLGRRFRLCVRSGSHYRGEVNVGGHRRADRTSDRQLKAVPPDDNSRPRCQHRGYHQCPNPDLGRFKSACTSLHGWGLAPRSALRSQSSRARATRAFLFAVPFARGSQSPVLQRHHPVFQQKDGQEMVPIIKSSRESPRAVRSTGALPPDVHRYDQATLRRPFYPVEPHSGPRLSVLRAGLRPLESCRTQ